MQQRRSGTQLIIAGVGVIVLVLVGGLFFMGRGGGGSSSSGKGGTNTASTTRGVVVALQSIPQGQSFFSNENLTSFFAVRQLPADLVPYGAYTSVTQIQGYLKSAGCNINSGPNCTGTAVTSQTIYQNLPVVAGMFSNLGQFRTAAGPAFQIPYGYVAQAVPLTDVNSVLGSIQPGDDIDLIASLTNLEDNSKSKGYQQTQYVLNDLRVIGVAGPIPPPQQSVPKSGASLPGSSSTSSTTNPTTTEAGGKVIVLVRYQQALILQHLKDFGGSWTISAVLRSSKETDIPHFRTLPVFLNWFFDKQDNKFYWTSPY